MNINSPATEGTSHVNNINATWTSAADVSTVLGITTKTVYARIDRGDIPATRFGRDWMIPRRWLATVIDTPPITHIDWDSALAAFLLEVDK